MSKVVVFGDDSDVNNLGNNFRPNEINIHEDGKSSDEGKSSVTQHEQRQPMSRMVSFDANIRNSGRNNNTSTKPLLSHKSSGSQLLVSTQTSMRNFQQSLDGYSGGGSPKSGSQNNIFPPKTSARKTSSQGGVADDIVGHTNLHRQKSVMGPKTAFEMQEVNEELSQGMSCGGK